MYCAMPCSLPQPTLVSGHDIATTGDDAFVVRAVSSGSARVRSMLKTSDTTTPPLLPVIIVVSNPVGFARRYILAREFMARFATTETHHAALYVVELAFNDQSFVVTTASNPQHLQLRTDTPPLWHKENMINIGVRRLLPPDWQAFAWIDADVEFESPTWAADAMRLLRDGAFDVIQLFSHAVDMNATEDAMSVFAGFGFQHTRGRTHTTGVPPINMWHPGYAWAMSRRAYDQMGGLFDVSILGAGDNNMAMALIGQAQRSLVAQGLTASYHAAIHRLETRVASLRLGYVPGVIRHFFHGHKAQRKYLERWQLLVRHKYDPDVHVTHRASDGLLVPTPECPAALLADVMAYFAQRDEDHGLEPEKPSD